MRLRAFFLPLLLVLAVVLVPQPSFAKYASIVVNETTGRVMYARNADRPLFPASLTKVMTLYLVFEEIEAGRLSLDTRMKVSQVAAGRSPSKLGLRVGATIRTRDAIMALITKSANDAATVIAEHIGGSEREFARRMTRKARALGMVNTTFRNASGLPHSKQKSTARDMARLAIAIRKDFPQYFHLFKTTRFAWQGKQYRNHNKLLANYSGTDGIKTGYTRASGFNLIATVERDGVRLVGVVFGGRTGASRDEHMRYLLTKQFNRLPDSTAPPIRQVAAPQAKPSQIVVSQGTASQGKSSQATASRVPLRIVAAPPRKPNLPESNLPGSNLPESNLPESNPPGSNPQPKPRQTAALQESRSLRLAASAPPPPPDLPTLADPAPAAPQAHDAWGIQIGSFPRQANAHIAARDARHAADSILHRQPAQVRPVQFGAVTFWQVRFHGFDEERARKACIALHQTGIACIALPAPRV